MEVPLLKRTLARIADLVLARLPERSGEQPTAPALSEVLTLPPTDPDTAVPAAYIELDLVELEARLRGEVGLPGPGSPAARGEEQAQESPRWVPVAPIVGPIQDRGRAAVRRLRGKLRARAGRAWRPRWDRLLIALACVVVPALVAIALRAG